jgi:intracellular sulfur oxidation DsrE/DsrF family protein
MTGPDRRNIFKSAIAIGAGIFVTRAAQAETVIDVPRVVYHLADLEKVAFVLGNIRNHIAGMGGHDKVKIALVVHGPALKAFRASSPNMAIKSDVGDAKSAGVELHACSHTMEAQKLTLGDLLPGFAVAEKGAVVKLAELQGQGWAYLRP